ncbi:MAG TPA: hypothetical protein V6C81_02630 [Planktothrix sp.]|jgi:hypothetical protein
MSARVVQGVFAVEQNAASCVRAIQNAGSDVGKISVVANVESFRSDASDFAARLDKFALGCAILMGVTGGFCGFQFASATTFAGNFLLLVPLLGALCGTVLGAYLGLIIGTVLNFDRPAFAIGMPPGTEAQGKIIVCVHTESLDETHKIEAIMEEHDVTETSSHSIAEELVA